MYHSLGTVESTTGNNAGRNSTCFLFGTLGASLSLCGQAFAPPLRPRKPVYELRGCVRSRKSSTEGVVNADACMHARARSRIEIGGAALRALVLFE